MEDAKEIKFEIVRKVRRALRTTAGAGRKELNLVAWNEREPKLDIRDWSEDHSAHGQGRHDDARRG
jgi:hypothetical protein